MTGPWVSRILAISQGSRPGDTMLMDICESHGMLWSGNTHFLHADYAVPVDWWPGCMTGLGLIQVIHSLFVVAGFSIRFDCFTSVLTVISKQLRCLCSMITGPSRPGIAKWLQRIRYNFTHSHSVSTLNVVSWVLCQVGSFDHRRPALYKRNKTLMYEWKRIY